MLRGGGRSKFKIKRPSADFVFGLYNKDRRNARGVIPRQWPRSTGKVCPDRACTLLYGEQYVCGSLLQTSRFEIEWSRDFSDGPVLLYYADPVPFRRDRGKYSGLTRNGHLHHGSSKCVRFGFSFFLFCTGPHMLITQPRFRSQFTIVTIAERQYGDWDTSTVFGKRSCGVIERYFYFYPDSTIRIRVTLLRSGNENHFIRKFYQNIIVK